VFANGLLPSGTEFIDGSSVAELEDVPVFRLVFGPPKSTKGQFVLSVDGLYYDSQTGGLPEVSGFIPTGEAYEFAQAANLGGKGQTVSTKDLDRFMDSIFDLTLIDNSPTMQTHYDADHFLSVLEGQKQKHVSDMKKQIDNQLLGTGVTSESAVVVNLRNAISSIIASHEGKINRRKKQIEVAVKAPSTFGASTSFAPGQVPINDFSFLQGLNITATLVQQNKLVFRQSEVSGVVLPLQPKFVKAQDAKGTVTMNHLVVPPIGKGGIIFDASSSEVSSAAVLSLNDLITTRGLTVIYNFLEAKAVSSNSTKFDVINCTTSGNNYNNGQLVGTNATLFPSGLGIPYLDGVSGNYLKLPDTTEMQDFTYSTEGFTMESWVYAPDLGTSAGWEVSSYHRLIAGCENTGGLASATDTARVPYDGGSETVRGMVWGFSRDVQVFSGTEPSDTDSDNVFNEAVFYVAPTQSVNTSDITFVNKNVGDCVSGNNILKCSYPISSIVSSVAFSDASAGFIHVALTVNVKDNYVALYCDGVSMVTSSIPDVFGITNNFPPSLPSFYGTSSFEHTNGPSLNKFFTPWIIGGGYSDGLDDGFMSIRSGKTSGLFGHIGSFKIYNNALTTAEIVKNFDAQKGFFKNILI
jgi:hypothetical protein